MSCYNSYPYGADSLSERNGSALVYLSFFLVLYREGMTGSILFAGVCAIIYFIVGIRFSND